MSRFELFLFYEFGLEITHENLRKAYAFARQEMSPSVFISALIAPDAASAVSRKRMRGARRHWLRFLPSWAAGSGVTGETVAALPPSRSRGGLLDRVWSGPYDPSCFDG